MILSPGSTQGKVIDSSICSSKTSSTKLFKPLSLAVRNLPEIGNGGRGQISVKNNPLYPKRHQQPLSAPFHQCFFALLCLEITVWQFVWRTSLWYFLSKCHKGCYQKKRYKAFKPLKGATCLTTVFFICKHKKVFSSLTKISRRRTLTKGSFASFAKNSSKPRGGGIVLNLPGGEGQSGALSNFSWQKSERKWKANPQTIES